MIEQVLSSLRIAGRFVDACHMRTSDQREIDLLARVDSELWAVEARLTAQPRREDVARLRANADLVGADRLFLLCHGSGWIEAESSVVCD